MTQEFLSKQLETQDDLTRIVYLSTDKLRTFAEHPHKIIDNDEMASLVESIKTQGVLTPIVVRPMENGEYRSLWKRPSADRPRTRTKRKASSRAFFTAEIAGISCGLTSIKRIRASVSLVARIIRE